MLVWFGLLHEETIEGVGDGFLSTVLALYFYLNISNLLFLTQPVHSDSTIGNNLTVMSLKIMFEFIVVCKHLIYI